MTELLDSGGIRVVAYLVATAASLLVGARELRADDREARSLWPTFWFITAGLLAVMAVARAGGLGDLLADIGREQAERSGWYDTRRTVQGLAVVAVSVGWFVTVVVAIWRVPPRRRRYLPPAISTFSVICFAAIRIVSLHQIDALLYRRDIAGVRIVSIAELGLLAVVLVTIERTLAVDRRTVRGRAA